MSFECGHCVDCTENAIGEKIAYCEVWGDWKNITLGCCFGNCDMQYQEGKVVNKPITNGDRIRAMTDEELVDTLIFWEGDWGRWVTDAGNFYKEDYGSFDEAHQSALKAEFEWLQQPCEGGKP